MKTIHILCVVLTFIFAFGGIFLLALIENQIWGQLSLLAATISWIVSLGVMDQAYKTKIFK